METQLKDVFEIKRDKSQLIANDDIYDFMAEIANCDNVILILTSEYVKSLNCMLEMAYLVSQDDWASKAMALVIDDSLYSLERKIEVINYWLLRQKRILNTDVDVGKSLYEEEQEYINLICVNIEQFFKGISRRKNPSQIAIVNEVIKKSKRNKQPEIEMIKSGEAKVIEAFQNNEKLTLGELSRITQMSSTSIRRHISNLIQKGYIQAVGNGKTRYYVYRN